jgi:NAD(P)-dependent dehydrogenase (short-subunit alcohol dehydrogenase family)
MTKCLIITGGSRGIGEQTIKLFAKNNWRVINLSRTPCDIENVKNIPADLSNLHLSDQQIADIESELKQADQISIVHNAAAYRSDNIKNLTTETLHEVLNINLYAAVSLNHLCLPFMQKGSSIIYIGSTLSEQAVPNRASYVISKHAIIGLMRSTCQDLSENQIHTCCICPGIVDTKMVTENVNLEMLNNFIQEKVIMKRLIKPEEIADLILYCVDHPIINGSVLHANLGHRMN